MATTNRFESKAFTDGLNAIQQRVNNSNTAFQRISSPRSTTGGISNLSRSDIESTDNTNRAISTNPYLHQLQSNNTRDFNEDTRRFNATLNAKQNALANEQSTIRYTSDNQLAGVRYGADAGVRSTEINASASRYNADRQLDGVRLQADASRYGADRGYQASIYNADRGVDQARIGADAQIRSSEIGAEASRFNALLGAGTAFFNSSQYRPTFNR